MAAIRTKRPQVGSVSWIAEERQSARQIVLTETEEFVYSARNEIDWLNEHMAEIFNGEQVNVIEMLKTPGKLRGKTPRTARKNLPVQERPPLSSIFSTTPRDRPTRLRFMNSREKSPSNLQVNEDTILSKNISTPSKHETKSPPKIPLDPSEPSDLAGQLDEFVQQPAENDKSQPAPLNESVKLSDIPHGRVENIVILETDSQQPVSVDWSIPSPEQQQPRKILMTPTVDASPVVNLDCQNNFIAEKPLYPILDLSELAKLHQSPSSPKSTPNKNSPRKQPYTKSPQPKNQEPTISQVQGPVDDNIDELNSPSDNSSPLRPMVRKSSLNFASLPPREPITTKKSIGNRVSRISQSEQSQTSYYTRKTSSNDLGNTTNEEEYHNVMEISQIDNDHTLCDDTETKMMLLHNKTSTQRLQDQISKLGQAQKNFRPSRSITDNINAQVTPAEPLQDTQVSPLGGTIPRYLSLESKTPPRESPDDKFNDLIRNSSSTTAQPAIFSPRSKTSLRNSMDINGYVDEENSHDKRNSSSLKPEEQTLTTSPDREANDSQPSGRISINYVQSISTSITCLPQNADNSPAAETQLYVSNLNQSTILNLEKKSSTSPKSPSKSYRGSPLKAAKDKFSSILKTSKSLFASSAIASAEAAMSASSSGPSVIVARDVIPFDDINFDAPEVYSLHREVSLENKNNQCLSKLTDTSTKISPRKTRASSEREVRRKEEEIKLSRATRQATAPPGMENQSEDVRMTNTDEVCLQQLEQERVAAIQEEFSAGKDNIEQVNPDQNNVTRATRISPTKLNVQFPGDGVTAPTIFPDESPDTEMLDVSHEMPQPVIPRPKARIGRPTAKRPVKPAKEATKSKPPTVIRVDTGSQRGHQYHPSNATLSATLKESLSSKSTVPSHSLRHKASTSSVQSKSSSSFRSAATKTLEAAARKKEQDDIAAARKREAKLEVERQRALIKEEERRKEEQKRREDIERQREIQRDREKAANNAEAKKAASRQAIEKRRLELEKAKEIRPPQPFVREKAGVEPEKVFPPSGSEMAGQLKPPPPAQRTQPDLARSVGSSIVNSSKIPPKRPLQQENEEHQLRSTHLRNGASNQHNEHQVKRHKTNDFDDNEDLVKNRSKMTAPPIRQSGIRQKEIHTKSLFPNGYVNTVPSSNLQRTTVISQHNMNQSKAAHPIDMVQLAKGPIPFASSLNQGNPQAHKTPARHVAPSSTSKSVAKPGPRTVLRSSPRYQNGETIELPEIHTDSEDSDSEDEGRVGVRPGWTDTPEIHKQLAYQESIDPAEVFGQPGPLNMEEVFSKSKDRFHKFRARTSSANWSGSDKLTEDEIQRDLEGRNRVRRQGGWTYDAMV